MEPIFTYMAELHTGGVFTVRRTVDGNMLTDKRCTSWNGCIVIHGGIM